MIFIAVLGLGAMLVVVALWTTAQNGGTRPYLAVSAVPLLLTIVVPAPFALRASGSSVWAQNAVIAVSRIGLTLSFILFTIGVVLTLRAALAGNRRTAVLFALETALAGLPAGIVTVHAALFRLL